MPRRVVVAGYGNLCRGDDGAGWHVAAAVRARRPPGLRVLTGQQLVPEWAPLLAEADVAYFVDADPQATVPTLAPLVAGDASSAGDVHAFGPASLLGLTRDLYGHAPAAFVLGIPAASFGFDDRLSPAAADAVRDAVDLLLGLLGRDPGPDRSRPLWGPHERD